jgi:hypothetical protein
MMAPMRKPSKGGFAERQTRDAACRAPVAPPPDAVVP